MITEHNKKNENQSSHDYAIQLLNLSQNKENLIKVGENKTLYIFSVSPSENHPAKELIQPIQRAVIANDETIKSLFLLKLFNYQEILKINIGDKVRLNNENLELTHLIFKLFNKKAIFKNNQNQFSVIDLSKPDVIHQLINSFKKKSPKLY